MLDSRIFGELCLAEIRSYELSAVLHEIQFHSYELSAVLFEIDYSSYQHI